MPERGVVYGVARDTTERRRAERRAARGAADARDEPRRAARAGRRAGRVAARGHAGRARTRPEAVFAAVGREVGEVLGVDATHLGRFDPDGTVVSVAQWGQLPGRPARGAVPARRRQRVGARAAEWAHRPAWAATTASPGTIAARCGEVGDPLLDRRAGLRRGADLGRDDRLLEGRRARSPPRPSRASRTSRSSWRPRSPTPAPTTGSVSWRTSRRRSGGSR